MLKLINRLFSLLPSAEAHCDTENGPAVVDGRRSLETGNINHALKWIPASGEAELREVSTRSCGSGATRTTRPTSAIGCSSRPSSASTGWPKASASPASWERSC